MGDYFSDEQFDEQNTLKNKESHKNQNVSNQDESNQSDTLKSSLSGNPDSMVKNKQSDDIVIDTTKIVQENQININIGNNSVNEKGKKTNVPLATVSNVSAYTLNNIENNIYKGKPIVTDIEGSKKVVKDAVSDDVEIITQKEVEESKKAVAVQSFVKHFNHFTKFLISNQKKGSDSDEYKAMVEAARSLYTSIKNEEFKATGYSEGVMLKVDALKESCELYNSKNRGFRWTKKGAKRQKEVNGFLNYLNWNMKSLDFMRQDEKNNFAENQAKSQKENELNNNIAKLKNAFFGGLGSLFGFKKKEPTEVDKFLEKAIRVPSDLTYSKKKDGSVDPAESLESTKEEITEISNLLNQSNEEREKTADHESKFSRLKTRLNRNKTHLFLNEHSDSKSVRTPEFIDLKESVLRLENIMSGKDVFKPKRDMDRILSAYDTAILLAKRYKKTIIPKTDDEKMRMKMVEDQLLRMERENEKLVLASSLIDANQLEGVKLNKPLDLFLLADTHRLKADDAELEGKLDKNYAANLTLEDFLALNGTYNRGKVSLKNGKLEISKNSYFQQTDIYQTYSILIGQDEKPTVENKQMKERLLALLTQKADFSDPEHIEFIENIRRELDLDKGATTSYPISRSVITDIVARAGATFSKVNKLRHIKTEDIRIMSELNEAQQKKTMASTAFSVFDIRSKTRKREMIGKTKEELEKYLKEEKKALYSPSDKQKKALKKKVNALLKNSKSLGMGRLTLSDHQMDNIINGNIANLNDKIYEAWEKIYNTAKTVSRNNELSIENICKDREIKEKLSILVLMRFSAEGESEAAIREDALNEYIREISYRLAGNRNGYEAASNINVEFLSSHGSVGLSEEIENRILEDKNIRGSKNISRVRNGGKILSTLCDNLKVLNEMVQRGFNEGIDASEIDTFTSLGSAVDEVMNDADAWADVVYVAGKLKGTRFHQGVERLKELKASGRSFNSMTIDLFSMLLRAVKKASDNENPPVEPEVKKSDQELSVGEKINMLEGDNKLLCGMLRMENIPSEMIAEPGDEISKQIVELRMALLSMPKDKPAQRDIQMGNAKAVLIQRKDNSLSLVVEGHVIPVEKSAQLIAQGIEEDMYFRTDLYSEDFIGNAFDEFDGNNQGNLIKYRTLLVKYLSGKTRSADGKSVKADAFFANVPFDTLKSWAKDVHNNVRNIEDIIREVEEIEKSVHITTKETEVLIKNLDKLKGEENVVMPAKVEEPVDIEDWSKDQRLVIDFVADLIFSKDSYIEDDENYKQKPGSRIAGIVESHPEAIVKIIKHPEILPGIFDKLPINSDEVTTEVTKSVLQLTSDKNLKPIMNADETAAVGIVKNFIGTIVNDEMLNTFAEIEKTLDKMTQKCSNSLQDQITIEANKLFSDKQEVLPALLNPNEKGISKEERKLRIKASTERLNKMLEEATRGSKGEGLFIKNILSNYFANVSAIDKRNMIACAIRYSKPAEKIPDDVDDDTRKKKESKVIGQYLGGLLKGAGPLLQKKLQGVPEVAIPEELKDAFKDMKSNLASIPEKVVKAQMQNIVDRSKGKIENIVVVKALGAASVGQAFMCKFQGPGYPPGGKEVVVKLLRPDVRNRMKREEEIMLKCARMTDQKVTDINKLNMNTEKGGMESTYEGQLIRIEEELDLTIESKNAQRGAVYDRGFSTVKSVKVDTSVEPTTNCLVLEKAPGTTVDKYLDEVTAVHDKWKNLIIDKERDEDGNLRTKSNSSELARDIIKARRELSQTLQTLRKRQKYLINLAESWVTEGIYGEGFYHGDPHAGNIMIDDKGVTVIDYGNATKLTKDQVVHVTRMMMAAAIGDVNIFEEGFKALLAGNITPEKYNEKKAQLVESFKEVFSMGDAKAAGQRIAVALIKAQNLGIEIPAAIFNFSQSQLRLQNTIDSFNKQINGIHETLEGSYNIQIMDATKDRTDWVAGIVNTSSKKSMTEELNKYIDRLTIKENDENLVKDLDNIREEKFKEKYLTSNMKEEFVLGVGLGIAGLKRFIAGLDGSAYGGTDNEQGRAELEKLMQNNVFPNIGTEIYETELDPIKETVLADIKTYTLESLNHALDIMKTLSEKNRAAKATDAYDEYLVAKKQGDLQEIEKCKTKFLDEYHDMKSKGLFAAASLLDGSKAELRLDWFIDDLPLLERNVNIWVNDETIEKDVRDEIKRTFEEYKTAAFAEASEMVRLKNEIKMEEEKDGDTQDAARLKDLRRQLDDATHEVARRAKNGIPQLDEKATTYLLAVRPAILKKFKDILQDISKNDESYEVPEDFINVMGGIINTNLSSSINKLGKMNALKVQRKMKSSGFDDDED